MGNTDAEEEVSNLYRNRMPIVNMPADASGAAVSDRLRQKC